ncbi:MAG: sigma-70 family RNA polymerase sigma factor [Solirubrobacteraceae bacterium]|nr:sigma-70 family RNA polymerase sigma factor [Patulibacter sp.]
MTRRARRLDRATDAALLAGDADAFAAFYRRHAPVMLGWLRKRTGHADLAADLAAETFARALEGRRSFDPLRGEARAWLFGIARHVLARSLDRGRVEDETRRRLGMEPISLDDAALRRIDEGAGPALALLASLPAEQGEAVAARVLGDQDYGDLASTLGCSESVVRKRVSRGLGALRQTIEEAQG